MGLYTEHLLPHLIRLTMRDRRLDPFRARAIAAAKGRVLEIGVGAGENLGHYGADVSEVIGLEPSRRLAAMARQAAARAARPVSIIEAAGESLPVDDGSIDTAVLTWTLCSIADPTVVLRNIRRALKPEGRLVFVEHGLAPEAAVRRWQRRLTPAWRHVAGGCHLDRDMPALIAGAGFEIRSLAAGYARGPRPLAYMYEGTATREGGPL